MAAPANDDFSNAQGPLSTTLPASASGTTFDSTKEATEPAFLSNDQSVWYYFIPASTGWYRFWIDPAENTDHNGRGLGLALGSPTTLAGWTTSAVETRVENPNTFIPTGFWTVAGYLSSGVTYHIKVYASKPGTINDQTSDFTLHWDTFTPPGNNDFASAVDLGSMPVSETDIDTYDCTSEASEPNPGGSTTDFVQSRWYKVTISSAGYYRFTLPVASFVHTGNHLHGTIGGIGQVPGTVTIEVFASSVSTLAGCTDANRIGTKSLGWTTATDQEILLDLAAGTYYIRALTTYKPKSTSDGIPRCFNDQAASITLNIDPIDSPANDNFASPTVLSTTLPGSLAGETTLDATQEATEPDVYATSTYIEQSVWYTFTPTATGPYIFRVPLDSLVYRGTSGVSSGEINIGIWDETALVDITTANRIATDSIYSDPTWGSPHNGKIIATLTSGVTYYIKVASAFGALNRSCCDFDLEWDAYVPPPPAPNNDFADRIVLTGASGTEDGSNMSADLETDEDEIYALGSGGIEYGGGKSVWYEWTAPGSGTTKFETKPLIGDTPIGDTILTVVTGTGPGDFTIVGQNDDDPDGGAYSEVTFTAVASTTYYICVDGYQGYPPSDGSWDPANATEGTFRLQWVGVAPPAPDNDDWADVWADGNNYAFNLDRGKYPTTPTAARSYPDASFRDGTTVDATAEVGEASRAGFAATRSVWYRFDPWDYTATYRVWVESSVDCVLGAYDVTNIGGTLGALLAEDDDSGTGDWPELVLDMAALYDDGDGVYSGRSFAIVVDSKTEGTFRLKYQKVYSGTPPANDDFDDAEVISSIPFSTSGTTVGARAEIEEANAERIDKGPRDTVWYKYVATFDGHIKIKGTCTSDNDDGYVYVDTWHGTVLETLVRHPEPPPIGPRGYFFNGDTPQETEAQALTLDVVNGETYYIRVQTRAGGSETFDIQGELNATYLDLQASGPDEMHGTLLDDATILVALQISAIEVYSVTFDAATILVDLQASGVDIKAFEYTDSGTVYVDLSTMTADECIFHLEPSWIVDGIRKWQWNGSARRWAVGDTSRRWAWIEGEGQPQIC